MALNFPDSPTLNQTYAEAGKVWIFNGSRWAMLSPAAFTLADSAVTTAKIAAGAVTAAKINNAVTLNDIPDVTITSVASGQVIQWNGAAWVNATVSSDVLTDTRNAALILMDIGA